MRSAAPSHPRRIPRRRAAAAFATGVLFALALGVARPARAAEPLPRVRVETSLGAFVIEVNAERAPLTAANFLDYVRSGQYDGTIFHRVISNFVIQGGGFDTSYKMKPTRAPVPNESGNGLSNKRGTVGIARSEVPHSANCQIYVNLNDNEDLDPQPLRWGYAVFGKVVEGMEVVERIGHVATGAVGPIVRDAPLEPVVIRHVELLNAPSAAASAPAPPAASPAP